MSNPQHLHGTVSVSRDARAFIESMVTRRGFDATARALGTVPTTLDRLLGPGVQRQTRIRIEQRIRDLLTPAAAGELVCTSDGCECSGSVAECDCIPDRPDDERTCKACGAPLREASE